KSGVQGRIISTVTLFNELMKERPHLVLRMFELFRMDLRGETRPGTIPYSLITPSQFAEGQLRTFYHSDYFRSVERHEGTELTPVEREILDFYDEKGLDHRLYLDMSLERGDMQFLSNHFIAHARTAYEDYDDPEMKRHLLRLWLSAA
ncbi:MAG: TauD/TfdA family dioxygenase, partial [Pseudomonadales bacterium]|nr:TauD/TfdA family dioxygenase [Pseudomonadales bacterium]